jgi:hypothetical protein
MPEARDSFKDESVNVDGCLYGLFPMTLFS